MTFNLEQIKDLIYVANSFEEWTDNGKKVPIQITEDIPMNLWNHFRIYLYRFCNENSVLILPPVKRIPANFLSGTFGRVEVSPSTEFICEKAFTKAQIQELKIPSEVLVQNGAFNKETINVEKTKEIDLYDIDYEKFKMDFARIKAISAFDMEKNIHSLTDVMESCNKKELSKDRITVLATKQFVQKVGFHKIIAEINKLTEREMDFSASKFVLIFDTGLIIKTVRIRPYNRLKCHAFIFESVDAF
ncbi:MAG: hypothetical protein MJ182_10375, partial [Treponema sp.]|nr:hypothetical protein [Treponema sp.]